MCGSIISESLEEIEKQEIRTSRSVFERFGLKSANLKGARGRNLSMTSVVLSSTGTGPFEPEVFYSARHISTELPWKRILILSQGR